MHTALCAFQDHATAERARDELLRSGFARQDVHLQHGDSGDDDDSRQDMLRNRGGVEHEIALDPHVVARVTGFFGHLFGREHPHRETWDSHVESGRTVVVVDVHDEAEAQRARVVMLQWQGTDTNVVHRPDQRPVRDILADTPMAGTGPLSTQPMAPQSTTTNPSTTTGRTEGWSDRTTAAGETWAERTARTEDRAVASSEQRPLDLGTTDDSDKVGLRYADKDDADKPLMNRDGLGRTRKDE
jgi:hypothetical protein